MDFLPSLPIILAFGLASALLAVTPGPDMTLFLGQTVAQGRRAGMAALAGAVTGLLVHTLFAAIGLSALLAASPSGFLALKVVGALYLLWLAVEALRHGSAFAVEGGEAARARIGRVFLKGLTINLLNPKIIVFFVTFLPQFVSAEDPHAAGKLFFLGLYFVALCAPICVLLILSADSIAAVLRRSPQATRVVDYLFAGVMGAFALKLLAAQAR